MRLPANGDRPAVEVPRDRSVVLTTTLCLVLLTGTARGQDDPSETTPPRVPDAAETDDVGDDAPDDVAAEAADDAAAAEPTERTEEVLEDATATEEHDGAPSVTEPSSSFDLQGAVEDMLSKAHGSVNVEYRMRAGDDDTDQDVFQWLDLRLGDENKDRISATFFLRSSYDLDGQRKHRDDYEFTQIEDTYDSSFNTRLYTAYVTYRPKDGLVDVARLGRQYVYAAETFQIDGVWAESALLEETLQLRATAYAGVPSHIYEKSPDGDWIVGGSISAEPFRGTRGSLDYVHVADKFSFSDKARDDLTSLRVWQRATEWLDLYGRVAYLDALRDYELRATGRWPEQDLMVQASYLSLLEEYDEEFTTEFDPYYSVLHTLEKYDQIRVRSVKGFGEDIVVEAGADIRNSDEDGPYNRDAHRVYVIPSIDRVPFEDSELSVILERWSGDGDRLETYGGEITHHFSPTLTATLGSDYSLYGYDAFQDRERNHVRSVYTDVRWDIRDNLELRLRYVHEEDDDETFDVLTLGFTLGF